MFGYLVIALGGALGSVARFAASASLDRATQSAFPWGTIAVNISGCFLIGLFAAATAPGGRFPVSSELRQFVMVGICGGYTTFSSFSLQTLVLARDGDLPRALLNVAFSVLFCILGVWLGSVVGSGIAQPRSA